MASLPSCANPARCATCGETSIHDHGWQAEVWADIHEFEHSATASASSSKPAPPD
jgi:hypothetical protein